MKDDMSSRNIRAPRGAKLNCKSWHQEAALRCLMNNLDRDVAEKPDELIVYGGAGKAARNWASYDAIVRELQSLENDETLLVQSGKPVGVFRTHEYAPRVLIANSNLVGAWANWQHFHELERRGLMMYGQMTAGSWIYIGTQGIVQGTFETFAAMADRHFGGDLSGKLVLSGGMGGMGGAQPLAAALNGAVFLGIDVDPERIERRVRTGYCDRIAMSLDEAIDICEDAGEQKRAVSVGLVGNCAEVLPEIVRRGITVDAIKDQTSAHDPLNDYVTAALIIAKIEDQLAVRAIADMINGADAIMIARGDLGIECPMEELPIIQRRIVKSCLRLGKPVIVATQMLESMITNPLPTRAEITDVANAVFEQADAIMLSAETSLGRYPVECVRVLNRVSLRIERSGGADYAESAVLGDNRQKTVASAVLLANSLANSKIIVFTRHGAMAHNVSKLRPENTRICAFTSSEEVYRQLSIYWSVYPVKIDFTNDPNATIEAAESFLRRTRLTAPGDQLVIIGDLRAGKERIDSVQLRTAK